MNLYLIMVANKLYIYDESQKSIGKLDYIQPPNDFMVFTSFSSNRSGYFENKNDLLKLGEILVNCKYKFERLVYSYDFSKGVSFIEIKKYIRAYRIKELLNEV